MAVLHGTARRGAGRQVPLWLSLPIYVMQAASKPALLMFGLRSRMVRVEGYGVFHFYDSGGPVSRTAAAPTATGPVPEPPVVLVHGMFTNGLSMVLVAAMLAKAGRRVIVPDLLCSDFGGSVALPGFENKVSQALATNRTVLVTHHHSQRHPNQPHDPPPTADRPPPTTPPSTTPLLSTHHPSTHHHSILPPPTSRSRTTRPR